MNIVDLISAVFEKHLLLISAMSIVGSFLVTNSSLPFVIYFSKVKKLTAKINERSSHTEAIPNIGGLGIIAGIYITTLTISFFCLNYEEIKFIVALFIPLMFLFFIGFKDDMIGLSAKAKLLTEIITSLVFIILTDYKIDNFYGLFGVHEINYVISILLSVFVFVITINSYNLIDGIDGLASGIGILALSVFLILNIEIENSVAIILCSSVIGSLISFLRFNLNSGNKKIFMGDTGSLVVGFLISVILILSLDFEQSSKSSFKNIPVLVLAAMSYPYVDTLRVMIIRKLKKRKFYQPDKNHIHHKLLEFGFTHKKSTLIILVCMLISILSVYLTKSLDISVHFFIGLALTLIIYLSLLHFFKK